MRWLVTGARGQLGTDVQRVLAGQDVVALGSQELDIADRVAVDEAMRAHSPNIIINCAAYNAVDEAETHEADALRVNAEGPALLAKWCAGAGATLVHVSTDYVFAGDAMTPYVEDAATVPASAYGRSKAAGERAVADSGATAYVVRTAWLYGDTGSNFVKTMLRLERERETVDVVDDQRGSPTWTGDLARGLVALARSGVEPGIYHCTNTGETTWCGFARAIFSEAGADPERVRPTTTAAFVRPAPRPAYSVLDTTRWHAAGLPTMPLWREALSQALRSFRS